MLNFLPNSQVAQSIEERESIDQADIERLSVWSAKFCEEADEIYSIPYIAPIVHDMFPISQKASSYSNMPYGKVGNIREAGCGPLAIEYAMRILGHSYTFEEILNECVNKGYRAYVFDEAGNIIDGVGSEHSLFNNNATTIKGAYDLLSTLWRGYPITLLVNNAIYHDDTTRKGNHFVTLIGIDVDQNLLIMDGNLITDENEPSVALVKRNFRKMAFGIRCAWAWKS